MESIPWKTAFNVQILDKGSNAFIHTSTAENTDEYWTVIDSQNHPLASDPNALVFATFNLSASTGSGKYFDKPIGVLYKDGQWAIYNRDHAPMPEGAAFNVQIVTPDTPGPNAFVCTVESTEENRTTINFSQPPCAGYCAMPPHVGCGCPRNAARHGAERHAMPRHPLYDFY